MISLDIPFLPKSQIISVAQDFLQQNNLTSIPIDIEFIAESKYGVHIIPFNGLKREYGIDGYSAHDFSSIYVDGFVFSERPNRLRFTVAHELGHRLLHERYLRTINWSSIHEWVDIYGQLDRKDTNSMEYQADAFAGLVLVPKSRLKVEFDKHLQSLKPQIEQAQSKGLGKTDYVEPVLHAIADELSRKFEVSSAVITIRMEFDSLHDKVP